MKLVCDACQMRYQISDALLRGKAVKLRCRRCGSVIEASLPGGPLQELRPSPDAEDEALVEPAEQQQPPESGPPLLPPQRSRPPGPPPLPERDWYVVMGGLQVGPLSQLELMALLRRGNIGPDDLAWRKGLETWQPVATVSPFDRIVGEMGVNPIDLGWQSPPERSLAQLKAPSVWRGGALPPGFWPAGAYAAGMPPVAAAPDPASGPARWPLLAVLAGGMLMMIAAVVWFGTNAIDRREPRAPVAQPRWGQSRGAMPRSARPVQPDREAPADESSVWILVDPPPIEVRRRGGPGSTPAAEAAVDSGPTRDQGPRNRSAWLAAQVLRLNRSTLIACDRLAEKRGETLQGSRAIFRVAVDADGAAIVEVSGAGVSSALLACYRSVARSWSFPTHDRPYSTSFSHIR